MPVALELGDEVPQHGAQQAQDGATGGADDTPGRAASRRRRRRRETKRGERGLTGRVAQLAEERIGVEGSQ
ncbi:MAG: hypothetical protein HYX33_01490 [Actinobacteria bacterium]|nr:hypothetical protein [Actinomycetota bacterium]